MLNYLLKRPWSLVQQSVERMLKRRALMISPRLTAVKRKSKKSSSMIRFFCQLKDDEFPVSLIMSLLNHFTMYLNGFKYF